MDPVTYDGAASRSTPVGTPASSRRYLMRALNGLPKISSCRTAPVSRSSHTRCRPPKLTRLRDGPASSGGKSSADLKSGGGATRPASAATRSSGLRGRPRTFATRSEEHTSELQSLAYLVCRLLLEKKKNK